MKKIILLVLFGSIFHDFLCAQNTKAKIITSNQDTIDAYVKLTTSEHTPQSFFYSINGSEPFTEISASKIKSVQFNTGDYFENYNISINVINKELIQRSKEDYYSSDSKLQGKVLLERLIDGSVSLFQFIDNYSFVHFFYKEKHENFVTYLPNNSYLENTDLKLDHSYKNLLSFLGTSGNCGEQEIKKLERTEYRFEPMLKAFSSINKCTGTIVNIESQLKKNKPVVHFGLSAGATLTGYRVDNRHATSKIYYNHSLKPSFGIFLEMYPAKQIKNYSLSIETSFQYAKLKSNVYYYSNSGGNYSAQDNFDLYYINLAIFGKYFIKKRSSGIFFSGGMNFGLSLYGLGLTNYDQGEQPSIINLILGVGYQINKSSVNLTYSQMGLSPRGVHTYGLMFRMPFF